jgi:hypothetical protein
MELLIKGIKVLIDDEDFERISMHQWSKSKGKNKQTYFSYHLPRSVGGCIYLHKYILNVGKAYTVDHINGDTLDNRKSNLRKCTHAQNIQNAGARGGISGYKGVFPIITKSGKVTGYFARIYCNMKRIYLGSAKTAEDAYKLYCDGAIKYHGEFARLK